MAEDGAISTIGSTYGYTDSELEEMPVWLVGVRLGLVDGSPGYPKGSRDVITPADKERQEEAAAARDSSPGRPRRQGRARPETWKPSVTDPGRVLRGEDAR